MDKMFEISSANKRKLNIITETMGDDTLSAESKFKFAKPSLERDDDVENSDLVPNFEFDLSLLDDFGITDGIKCYSEDQLSLRSPRDLSSFISDDVCVFQIQSCSKKSKFLADDYSKSFKKVSDNGDEHKFCTNTKCKTATVGISTLKVDMSTSVSSDIESDNKRSSCFRHESNVIKGIVSPSKDSSPKTTNLPRGYMSAFNIYVVQNRSQVLRENPHLEKFNNTLNKLLGDKWKKELTKDDRNKYENLSQLDKSRYLSEVAAYNKDSTVKIVPRINPPPGYNVDGSKIPETSKSQKGSNKRTLKTKSVVNRPLTAYSIFAKQEKKFLRALGTKSDIHRNMGKYFGMRWRSMSPEEKQLYINLENSHRISQTDSSIRHCCSEDESSDTTV